MRESVSPLRLKAAWAVAVGVDGIQFLVLPATIQGGFSPIEVSLDLAAMGLLWLLVGWHWAFLPSVVMELIPIVDLAPTWTIAMAIASRGLHTQDPIRGTAPNPGSPKEVTPAEDGRTITVEAKSSSSPTKLDP